MRAMTTVLQRDVLWEKTSVKKKNIDLQSERAVECVKIYISRIQYVPIPADKHKLYRNVLSKVINFEIVYLPLLLVNYLF